MSLRERGGGARRPFKRKGSRSTFHKEKLFGEESYLCISPCSLIKGRGWNFPSLLSFSLSLAVAYTALAVTVKSAANFQTVAV